MHIAKIIKKEKKVGLVFCDKDLKVLEEESFEDVYSLNFFLQTLPRKYDVEKTLLIVHDQRLNMVDMQQPLSPIYTHPILKKAIEFIDQNILSKKILIHCNQGESRAPSIALVYLAHKGKINNANFQLAVVDFKDIYPSYIPGTGIFLYVRNYWQDIMNLV